jgi:two-component system KDP operon response regulator KdpE
MPNSNEQILVIEDEMAIRRFLRTSLTNHNYSVIEAATGNDGIAQASSQRIDIIILDLGLPDMDGLQVIQRVREWSTTPIIILSARGQESDKIAALDAGADDYLTKPFGVGELIARIRVALRHATRARANSKEEEAVFSVGSLRLDFAKHQVFIDDQEIHLTPIEYNLLATLSQHAGKVLTHRQLLTQVWGTAYVNETQILRVHMMQLRHKIERDPARPRYLVTELGVGYRLRADN